MKRMLVGFVLTLLSGMALSSDPTTIDIKLEITNINDESVVNFSKRINVTLESVEVVNFQNGKNNYEVVVFPRLLRDDVVVVDYDVRVPKFVVGFENFTTEDGKTSLSLPITANGASGHVGLKKDLAVKVYEAPKNVTVTMVAK